MFSLDGFCLCFLFCFLATVLVGRFLSRFFVLCPGNCSRWKVSLYVFCFVSWQLFSLEGFSLGFLFCFLATVLVGRFLSRFFVLFPGNCSLWKVSLYVLCFVPWQLFALEGFYLCFGFVSWHLFSLTSVKLSVLVDVY